MTSISIRQAVDLQLDRQRSISDEIFNVTPDLQKPTGRTGTELANYLLTKSNHLREWTLLYSTINGQNDGASAIGSIGTINSGHIISGIKAMHAERDWLSQPTHFVSDDIMSIITTAASKLEPEPLRATDLIAPCGTIMLENPIIIGDYHPETGDWNPDIHMGWRSISWTTTNVGVAQSDGSITMQTGVQITIYTSTGLMHELFYPSVTALGIPGYEKGIDIASRLSDELIPTDIHGWAFDSPWTYDPTLSARDVHISTAERIMPEHITHLRTWFLSFMRFCWQQMLVIEPATLPRPIRRAATRQLGIDNIMNIVKLRRSNHTSESPGTGARLDHLVVVRGHWRNQYYRSLGPASDPASHRLIWIHPHLRGPDDGELVERPKVTVV